MSQSAAISDRPSTQGLYPSFHALQTPDKPAFIMCKTGETVTYRQLNERSNQGAHLLRLCGLKIGDHVAILMENCREFLEVCFSADRSGLYFTAISTHLTADEVAHIINDCEAKVVVFSASFVDLMSSIRDKLPAKTRLLVVGDRNPEFASWHEQARHLPSTPITNESQGVDMLYSSGTTGQPKGIKWELTGERPGTNTMKTDLLSGLYGYSESTRYLNPAPLYHAAPLRHCMVTIKMGGSVFIMDKFDAETSLSLIDQHRITHSQWVPTMFVRLLRLPDEVRAKYDTSSLQMVVHAAAPCPVDIKQRMIQWWGPIIHEYYAGTENNGFCAINTQEWLTHIGSVGQAKLGVLHICDPDGNELPIGEEGEVYFAEGHQFSYHNKPAETEASRNQLGWTTLGDIGKLDDEGYLYLTDRKSFMIISGGVNIYPREIEDVIISHPQVADVAVIGVPNDDFGEEVKAIVQPLAANYASDQLETELLALCKRGLSKIKIPTSIDFVEALPRSPTGKLFKRVLKDQYWPDH